MEAAVYTTAAQQPPIPYERRHARIHFTDTAGTVGEYAIPINYEEVYNLKGRLLTLVDATFTDPQQRKAHKDIVWQTLKGWYEDLERDAGVRPYENPPHDESTP